MEDDEEEVEEVHGKEEVKDVVAKGSQITIDMAAARTLTSSEGGVDNEQFFSLLQ